VVNAGLDPAWAIPAAFGDFTAAVLTFITLLSVNSRWFQSLLWAFNWSVIASQFLILYPERCKTIF
jgi:hypothetical protein